MLTLLHPKPEHTETEAFSDITTSLPGLFIHNFVLFCIVFAWKIVSFRPSENYLFYGSSILGPFC